MFHSVQLFVDRARASLPDFRITSRNAAAVAELCDRLEGLPLAIELAAARASAMTPSQMLAHLGRRFEFLVSRKRGVAERHRTMRAAIDWSWRLLSPELQTFFARLSVFRGGWTAEAAEAVCDEPLALDHLAMLRECSLVQTDDRGSEMRFRMLETLREYGDEQLTSVERTLAQRRHWEFFLSLAEEAKPHLQGPDQLIWLDRLDAEHDNLRAALERLRDDPDGGDLGLRMCSTAMRFWHTRCNWTEGRTSLLAAIAHAGAQARTEARADALNLAGSFSMQLGDFTDARALCEQSLQIRRDLDNHAGIANSLNALSNIAVSLNDYATGRALLEEALPHSRDAGDRRVEARVLYSLGNTVSYQEDYEFAFRCLDASLSIHRSLGDTVEIARGLFGLGSSFAEQSKWPEAKEYLEEALGIQRDLGDAAGQAIALNWLATVFRNEGLLHRAEESLLESLTLGLRIGSRRVGLGTLENLVRLACAWSQYVRAARIYAAADDMSEAMGRSRQPNDRQIIEQLMAVMRLGMGDERLDQELQIGRAMTWEQAVAYALNSTND